MAGWLGARERNEVERFAPGQTSNAGRPAGATRVPGRECPSGHVGLAHVGSEADYTRLPYNAVGKLKRSAAARSGRRPANTAEKGFFGFFAGRMEAKVPKNTGSCHETKDMNEKTMTSYVTKWSTRRAKGSFLFLKNQSVKIKKCLLAWRVFLRSGLC